MQRRLRWLLLLSQHVEFSAVARGFLGGLTGTVLRGLACLQCLRTSRPLVTSSSVNATGRWVWMTVELSSTGKCFKKGCSASDTTKKSMHLPLPVESKHVCVLLLGAPMRARSA